MGKTFENTLEQTTVTTTNTQLAVENQSSKKAAPLPADSILNLPKVDILDLRNKGGVKTTETAEKTNSDENKSGDTPNVNDEPKDDSSTDSTKRQKIEPNEDRKSESDEKQKTESDEKQKTESDEKQKTESDAKQKTESDEDKTNVPENNAQTESASVLWGGDTKASSARHQPMQVSIQSDGSATVKVQPGDTAWDVARRLLEQQAVAANSTEKPTNKEIYDKLKELESTNGKSLTLIKPGEEIAIAQADVAKATATSDSNEANKQNKESKSESDSNETNNQEKSKDGKEQTDENKAAKSTDTVVPQDYKAEDGTTYTVTAKDQTGTPTEFKVTSGDKTVSYKLNGGTWESDESGKVETKPEMQVAVTEDGTIEIDHRIKTENGNFRRSIKLSNGTAEVKQLQIMA